MHYYKKECIYFLKYCHKYTSSCVYSLSLCLCISRMIAARIAFTGTCTRTTAGARYPRAAMDRRQYVNVVMVSVLLLLRCLGLQFFAILVVKKIYSFTMTSRSYKLLNL